MSRIVIRAVPYCWLYKNSTPTRIPTVWFNNVNQHTRMYTARILPLMKWTRRHKIVVHTVILHYFFNTIDVFQNLSMHAVHQIHIFAQFDTSMWHQNIRYKITTFLPYLCIRKHQYVFNILRIHILS